MDTLLGQMGSGMAELWCGKVGSKWPDWATEICLRQGKKLTTAITLALQIGMGCFKVAALSM